MSGTMKSGQNVPPGVVDIRIGVLSCAATGKTLLLEALCVHQNVLGEAFDAKRTVLEMRLSILASKQPPPASLATSREKVMSSGTSVWSSMPILRSLLGDGIMYPTAKKAKVGEHVSASPAKGTKKAAPTTPTTLTVIQDVKGAGKYPELAHRIVEVETDESVIDMRQGTRLVLLKFPSFSSSSVSFKKSVESIWPSFDCVIVMINVRDGPDHAEHKELLRMVKKLHDSKSVPIVIVGNKMDLCDEFDLPRYTKQKITTLTDIFGGAVAITPDISALPSVGSKVPVFVPMSIRYACFYRVASLFTLDDLKRNLNEPEFRSCFNKLGRNELGRHEWDVLTQEDKAREVYDMLHTQESLQTLLKATNFDKLGTVLTALLNSDEVLASKIEYLLSSITFQRGSLVKQMSRVGLQLDALQHSKESLKALFWNIVDEEEIVRSKKLRCNLRVACLAPLMNELILYHDFSMQQQWVAEASKAKHRMRELLRSQIEILCRLSESWNLFSWKQVKDLQRRDDSWPSLSPIDWKRIFMSVLLLEREPAFCKHFSHEILILKEKVQTLSFHSLCCSAKTCHSKVCNHPNHLSLFSAVSPRDQHGEMVVHNPIVHNPRDLSETDHWGHLAWLYCGFMNKCDD